MVDLVFNIVIDRVIRITAAISLLIICLASCASIDPAKVDSELPRTLPISKVTSYSNALYRLGLMTQIYATDTLKIQCKPISDRTGATISTGGEIPKDISEMVKSVLNSVGGNLVYIPYDPAFIQNQMVTGYSNFQNKVVPDVVVSGGITEFDRGLETRDKNSDISTEVDYDGLDDYLPGMDEQVKYPSKEILFRYGARGKFGLARITLDFNLLDFQSMSGISRVNAVNTIEVHKTSAERELGISIFGQAFGRKGNIKKVQGRHAAIRLLVELSMMQIIGKQLLVPYWKLLGQDALPDQLVLDSASTFYNDLNLPQKIRITQHQLFLHGYDVPISGVLDKATGSALQAYFKTYVPPRVLDTDDFLKLWESIPINIKTLNRRHIIKNIEAKLQKKQRESDMKKEKSSKDSTQMQQNKKRSITFQEVDQLLRMLEEKKKGDHQKDR